MSDQSSIQMQDMGKGALSTTVSAMERKEAGFENELKTRVIKKKLARRFDFISTIAFASTLLASWESINSALGAGLTNGGPVGLVYGLILAITGTLSLALSLGEMASITPIAGAQYHWAAELAPPRYSRFISWMQGWITVFAWQATVCSVIFLTAGQIQAVAILNYPDYVPERWHATLMMWAVLIFDLMVNLKGISILPKVETFAGLCHILFFFAILIPLVYLAPRSTAEYVFTDFESNGGWEQNGIAWSVGLLTSVYSFVGFDGIVHMSEEVKTPHTTVPRSMVLSIVINGTLAFAMLLTLLFCIGDVDAALSSPTGYPCIEIFQQATNSTAAATAMMSAIIIIAFASGFGILASTSRLTWAFARDQGLPFSNYFSYVDEKSRIPTRAIALVSGITVLLSLIQIGSTTAFYAVLSLSTLALYISYLIPITLLVMQRFNGKAALTLERSQFNLGKFGMPINIFALVFGIYVSIFLPFPPNYPVTAQNMNYAGPVFVAILIFSLVDWFVRGKKNFIGPAVLATMKEEGTLE